MFDKENTTAIWQESRLSYGPSTVQTLRRGVLHVKTKSLPQAAGFIVKVGL